MDYVVKHAIFLFCESYCTYAHYIPELTGLNDESEKSLPDSEHCFLQDRRNIQDLTIPLTLPIVTAPPSGGNHIHYLQRKYLGDREN